MPSPVLEAGDLELSDGSAPMDQGLGAKPARSRMQEADREGGREMIIQMTKLC